jgi:hypothetical protein
MGFKILLESEFRISTFLLSLKYPQIGGSILLTGDFFLYSYETPGLLAARFLVEFLIFKNELSDNLD